MKNIQKIRGTVDLNQYDLFLFDYIVNIVKKLSKSYAFQQYLTPIIEHSAVFHKTLGYTSDIISKETYNFIDRDRKSLILRPEFTAAVARAALENNMLQTVPLKLFSYGPLFRHERPQKCRLRQFNQFNFEYIGTRGNSPIIESLLLADSIIKTLELTNIRLCINHIGSKDDRSRYKNALQKYFLKYINDLSITNKKKIETNPLRILDSKENKDQIIIQEAPSINNFLNDTSKENLDFIMEQLNRLNIDFQISSTLVRGIDYYSDIVFEFITQDLGSQGTIIAGGCYNDLIKHKDNSRTLSVGFAGGFERIMHLLKIKNLKQYKNRVFYLVPIGIIAENYANVLAYKLRTYYSLCIDLHFQLSLKKRMKKAHQLQYSYVVIFGEHEIKRKELLIKNMKTGIEHSVLESQISIFLNTNIFHC